MTACVVEIDFRIPDESGVDAPLHHGYIQFVPTRRRDMEGYISLPNPFKVYLENGQATVSLEPTTDEWFWKAMEGVPFGETLYLVVPDGPGPVDYDDLVQIDPTTLEPVPSGVPAWQGPLTAETVARVAADANLQSQIDAITTTDAYQARAVSTDGSLGLPLVTGVGFEWVYTAGELVGPQVDGVPS